MSAHIVRCSVLIAATALALTSPMRAQSGNDLYQQALVAGNAGREHQGSDPLFERIVGDSPSGPRPCRESMLQLGRWSESAGQDQARTTYQRDPRVAGQSRPGRPCRASEDEAHGARATPRQPHQPR